MNIVQYIIFYTAFLLILLAVSTYLPIEIIEGITEDEINTLKENVVLPAEPSIVDYVIFPFSFIYSIINKALILLTVSTAHQFIAVILTPFTLGFLWKIVELVRGK